MAFLSYQIYFMSLNYKPLFENVNNIYFNSVFHFDFNLGDIDQ